MKAEYHNVDVDIDENNEIWIYDHESDELLNILYAPGGVTEDDPNDEA